MRGSMWSIRGSAVLAASAVILLGLQAPAHATPNVYVVSPSGSDTNDGSSLATAFETVQHCADVAQPGDTCRIAAGTYRESVTPPTSGTAAAPITFTAFGNGEVRIDGSDLVDTSWSQVSSGALAALQSAEPRLNTAPIVDAVADGELFQTTVELDTDAATGQMFIDGEMANIAQWPDPGSDLSHPDLALAQSASESGLSGTINDANLTQPAGYWVGTKAWINAWFVSQTAAVTTSSVGQIVMNPVGCKTVSNTRCGVLTYTGGHGVRYRLYGTMMAMSAPGQWLYSPSDDKLYLWLEAGDSPSAHTITSKARTNAFDLSEASYITVRGISIFGSTIVTGEGTTGNLIDGIDAKYLSHYNDLASEPNLEYNTGYNVITAGEVSSGIQLNGSGNTIRNSSIAFSAGNGVVLRGQENSVINNYIHDVNYQGSYAAGINLTGTDQTIMYNTVFDVGRSALNTDDHVNGSDAQNNRVAYNDFSKAGELSSDLGIIYVCCDLDMTGTRIDHNWIHDPAPNSHDQGGIFFDCGIGNSTATRGAQADRNVIWNTTSRGFVVNGGSSLKLVNNTATKGSFAQTICGHSPSYVSTNNIVTSQVPASDFVNGGAFDFRLTSGATSVNTGTVSSPVTDGYKGTNPDKGAYEFGGPNWVGGCTWGPCWEDKTGYSGESTMYEAEDGTLASATEESGELGWSGGGFVSIGTATNSADTVTVSADETATQKLWIRYAVPHGSTPSVDRTVSLYVNGTKVRQLEFPTTESASDWAILPTTASLTAGTNTVALRVDAADTGGVAIDSLVLKPTVRPSTERIEAEGANDRSGTTVYTGGSNSFVGNIQSGNWLKYEQLDFGSGGLTSFQARISADASAVGKQIAVRLDSLTGPVVGTLTVASTGGWYTFATQSAAITSTTGVHDVFLVPVGTGLSGYAGIDWITFGKSAAQTIQAEGANDRSGTTDYSGGSGSFVGNIQSGNWLKYEQLDFGGAGLTTFQARISADASAAGKQIAVRLDSLTGTVVGTLTVASTGGWYTFATQSTPITATTGVHDVYLVPVGSGLSGYAGIDWITFGTSAAQTIQAENANARSGTSVYSGGSGSFVGNIQSGNWLKYAQLDFGSSGLTSFQARISADASAAGKQIAVRLDSLSGTVIGTITVASTGGWYTFTTQTTTITSTTGVHDVYLVPVGTGLSGYAGIDWIVFS